MPSKIASVLSPGQVPCAELAGEKVLSVINEAPGNHAPIGGVKVSAATGWFAARPSGTEAELIDGESELPSDLLAAHEVVGLTAGASTPGELVDATIEQLAGRGYEDVVEVTVAREDVHFRLPREVASA